MNKLITKARAGVTLVELLVVILIVVILSVSLLPLLKPYIVKAQYAAEPVPVLGNLRTQIGLYQYEKNYLPGLPKLSNGEVDLTNTYGNDPDGTGVWPKGGSTFTQDKQYGGNQSWVSVKSQGSDLYTYQTAIGGYSSGKTTPTWYDGNGADAAGTKDANGNVVPMTSQSYLAVSNHLADCININYEDLTGKRMRPKHIQYRVLCGGYKTGTYAYAIGVFGDDDGLASGTGYAVIEIVNPTYNVKYVGTWERYKKTDGAAGQIAFGTAAELTGFTGGDFKQANCCSLGNPGLYLSSQANKESDILRGIEELKKAGWEF